ncbi:peptidoglycan-binding domain-containing protein [Parasulfitobacter algicola]|uniref:Peptidoglycan-binding protein n=1 Tax=Parasulfitobacter algicola TaxID=2614809 RepID=A0ABX2IWY0_9RHOB|nr:peptidoglycan-binding protein [Sulfitobacter algicola]NSX54969.1 peptidoglycan-binding protein [Sulfitobacter algicola]
MRRFLLSTFIASVGVVPAFAQDVALVIGNRSYDDAPRVSDASKVRETADLLEDDGFTVLYGRDLTAVEMQNLSDKMFDEVSLGDPSRLLVFLAGHVVMWQDDAYLLGTDANDITSVNIGRNALPIAPLMDLISARQGSAVVMLSPSDNAPTGPRLLGKLEEMWTFPQGVTYASGDVDGLNETLETLLSGRSYSDMAVTAPDGVLVRGFMTYQSGFAQNEEGQSDVSSASAEDGYWKATQDLGTEDSYRAYLRAYPRGQYVDDANRQIVALRGDPERGARQTEEALELSRDDRRQIQRDLTLLEYDTRGIDGIFGPGTRGAITKWQRENGYEASSYITRPQIVAMRAQAQERAAVLEEEARRRQEEQDREDRAYWERTGTSGDEDDLRAYVERYPDGIYSDQAREQLEEYEAEKRAEAKGEEREYWDQVKERNSVEAYREYLQRYPDGSFVPVAEASITELQSDDRNSDAVAQARAEEGRIAGNQIARLLAEQGLAANGTDPGRIDGRFTDKTRRAIRQFQRARNIEVTGYISQETAVQLLGGR